MLNDEDPATLEARTGVWEKPDPGEQRPLSDLPLMLENAPELIRQIQLGTPFECTLEPRLRFVEAKVLFVLYLRLREAFTWKTAEA